MTRALLLTALCMGMLPVSGWSQAFPVKPVRIVTAEPGGGNELAARILAQELTQAFGQQVIVESRGGANGALAAQAVAKAPPDGYTWLIYSNSLWVLPLIKDLPWDVWRDFAPVALLAQSPTLLVVHPSLPVRSVADLIELARTRPGELNYSSGSTGAVVHLAPELFKTMTKTDIVRVRYKGTGPALLALMSGEVQLMFPVAGSVTHYVKTGKVRALAITSAQRSALAPQLPTLAEAGLPRYEAAAGYGLFAPAKTPAALIARVSEPAIRALQMPEVKQRFLNAGIEPIGGPGDRLEATMRADVAKWGKLVRDNAIKDD